MSNAIANIKHEISTRQGFRDFVGKIADMCAEIVPLDLPPEKVRQAGQRMAANIAALSAKTPALRECSPQSLAVAVAECAALDLMPTTHRFAQVYLIPRRNKGVMEVSAQISSRGLQTLAQRDGWTLFAAVVYKGETFKLTGGLAPSIEHEPSPEGNRPDGARFDNVVGAYVVARKPGSEPTFRYLPRGGIIDRKAKAQTDKFWRTWPEEMILKTVLAYGLSRGMIPLADHMSYALQMVDAEASASAPTAIRDTYDPLEIAGVAQLTDAQELDFEDLTVGEQVHQLEQKLLTRVESYGGKVESVWKAASLKDHPGDMDAAGIATYHGWLIEQVQGLDS